MKRTTITALTALALTLGTIPLTNAADATTPGYAYGRDLMTQQERNEFRQRMRNARTLEEREQIRAENHARMQQRAKERGLQLPEQPMPRGMGRGMGAGPGMGPGMGGPRW